MKLWIASFVSMLLAAGFAVADMYKWVDENGKVHYTDSPPPDKKSKKLDLKVNSISGPPVVSAFSGGAAGTKRAPAKIIMYSTATCGYCKQARAYLQARRLPFEDIDVERSLNGQAEFRALGGRGVPIILVGAQRMDGYREQALAGLLNHAGL